MNPFAAAAAKVRHTDPLLRITKGLLVAVMAIITLVIVGIAAAIPAMWLYPSTINIDGTVLPHAAYGAISLIVIMAVLGILALRQIVAIVDSVKIGSPFVPENARRLRLAAWFIVAIELLSFLAEPIASWIRTYVDTRAEFDIEVSFGWIITALLLFILARVFDHGTRLAEEAEGTV